MRPRSRILGYGSAAVLVIAGGACAATLSDVAGQLVALVLIGLGLVSATGLVFLEVGLSEDRARAGEGGARASEDRAGASEDRAGASEQAPGGPAPPRRVPRPDLGRSRGHRRRLG